MNDATEKMLPLTQNCLNLMDLNSVNDIIGVGYISKGEEL